MGYTHYFTQKRHATDEEWDNITHDFRTLYNNGDLPTIQFEDDIDNPPQIDGDMIRFNGPGDQGCETMALRRKWTGSDFCKTGEKPYDSAVTALLALCHYHAPDVWEIRSDGDMDDWEEGILIATRAFNDAQLASGMPVPPLLREPEG